MDFLKSSNIKNGKRVHLQILRIDDLYYNDKKNNREEFLIQMD
jgi:hypothetical protein